MPRTCTVCDHEQREAIDSALVGGESLRNIAERTGTSPTSLHRHFKGHVSRSLERAQQERQDVAARTLLDRIEALVSKLERLADTADATDDAHRLLQTADRLDKLYRLLGNVTGDLDDRPAMTVNILTSPEWLAVRGTVLEALTPHAEARASVSHALRALEAGSP
jgi:AcrR family transcriptional regulator